MIDDDTYLLMDNMADYLADYDYTKPYYFGAHTVFAGCDGVTKFGDGPAFAHGGSGIILSRGAVETMLKISDTCITKYKTCWAGDIRVALCLRDAGILLQSPGLFTKYPPNNKFYYGDPCTRQISFHHLLVYQTQELFQVELEKKNGNLTLDVIAPYFLSEEIQSGFNRAGGDYTHFQSPSVEECQVACRKDIKCVAFSFANSLCWLKSHIPDTSEAPGTASGVVLDHYKCKK
jgi:hypothetical protein